ncbi:DUF3857 domain-containing protein [Myroides ceti]|uniref:DUF3857 domain-containing protein n=1 Tax=Paenimyroides ceti TaxID=395087 RepID=A0ABT8CQ74_9FLAO|nr:DUF3857 domain-containing protein [Paenimyroides ceti]MDN3706475.1 DUF3857 domain-containing protein [Paenimyroides ceti]
MKKTLLTLLLFLFTFLFYSQERKIGKVTVEQLKETQHSKESDAPAAILFSIGHSELYYTGSDHKIKHNVKLKLKIYKKEGLDWANKTISFYSQNNNTREIIKINEANTYNLVDGKIVKTKLKSDGEFVEKVNEYWSIKKIAFPNVSEGSIIELDYTVDSPLLMTLPDWNFQTYIPTDYSELTTLVPQFFAYMPYFRGSLQPKIKTNIKDIQIDLKNGDAMYKSKGFANVLYKQGSNSALVNLMENEITYSLSDIPSIKKENYVNNIENYISTIEHSLVSINYGNGNVKSFSMTDEDLVKHIYKSDSFGTELKKTNYFDADLNGLLKDFEGNQILKMELIYNFVKNKMNWNKKNSFYATSSLSTAYKNNEGSAADINLILIAMFEKAGFKANPILLSTRSNGIKLYNTLQSYNYVIAGVEIEGNLYLLDATNKNLTPNILPVNTLNWKGAYLLNQKIQTVDLYPSFISPLKIEINATINDENKVVGKIKEDYYLYNAYVKREIYGKITNDDFQKRLSANYAGLKVDNLFIQRFNDLNKPLTYSYSFTDSNSIDVIGEKLFVDPMLFFTETEHEFKSPTRDFPIDFIYPSSQNILINMEIPEGYIVEKIPENKTIISDEMIGLNFEYKIVQKENNMLGIIYKLEKRNSLISNTNYAQVKTFFDSVILKNTEKIILKKI